MEGINDKWVDLSGLPKISTGKWTGKVDWKNSIGYDIPFKYGNVYNKIHIVDYERSNNTYVWIIIDKYVPEPRKFNTQYIIHCNLCHLVDNRIIDNAPEMLRYLVNKDDAYEYACCSNKFILMKCPICGREKLSMIHEVYNKGFKCDVCGDGISYPNKFIANVLTQLNVDFIREASRKYNEFKWCQKYRYDFATHINNQNIIIEADGGFHREEQQKTIDKEKDRLAKENNFRIIRIDCDYKECNKFEFIKNSIMNSELRNILQLDLVNWEECGRASTQNVMHYVCSLWENNLLSVGAIKNITKLSASAIHVYLKRGQKLGLCSSYCKREAQHRKQSTPIAYMSNGEIIHVFQKTQEVVDKSLLVFGVQCTSDGVIGVCAGRHKTHRGLTFKYITIEEYLQYKMIENKNNEVVKEVAV